MQQFLVPDQTPPILEAEMALRAEQVNNSKQKRSDSVQSDGGLPSRRHIMTPDSDGQTVSPEPPTQNQRQEKKQEVVGRKKLQPEPDKKRTDDRKLEETNQNGIEERQEPEGRQADATVTEVCLFMTSNIFSFDLLVEAPSLLS